MHPLAEKIIQHAEAMDFSGAISIFQDDNALLNKAFGFRDEANGLANEKDTMFGIASGTKLFTALGIGQLIEQGKLKLDSTIAAIYKDQSSFIDADATISQLLSHTSGIYDFYDEEVVADADDFFVDIPWYRLETNLDYLPLFVDQQPKFTAGERFSYSNGGFVFLGMLIEIVSGKRYRDFIAEYVLGPAQMSHSGFFAMNALPQNTATGYLSNRKTSNIYNLPIRGAGDGGMFTNTLDLKSFWQQLFAYNILSKEVTEALLQTQWAFDDKHGYGSGIYKTLDNTMFSIVGGDAGVGFDSRYLPQEKIVITILANITDGEEEMREFILAQLSELLLS